MFERAWTVCVLPGDGPVAVPVETQLPGGSPRLLIEAWKSGETGFSAVILDGQIDLPEAQQRISDTGTADVLLSIPGGAMAWRKWSGGGWLTVLVPGKVPVTDAAPAFVTLKVRQVP